MTTERSADQAMLATIYDGWETYQGHLVTALTPLTPAQLALRVAPQLRSIGELATHIVRARAGWVHGALNEGGEELAALAALPDNAPGRTGADLAEGLRVTWRCLRDVLDRWTPADLAAPITRTRRGVERTFTGQWVLWHLIEHDLHHGGELSYSLGIFGIPALDI